MKASQHIEAADFWHHQIEHNDVVLSQLNLRERISATARRIHVVALSPEDGCDKAKDRPVIIDHQDSLGAHPLTGCFNRAMHTNYLKIYRIVRQIPRGRVATYGQVATLAGLDGHARQVGYALHALPSSMKVPWHRVVNSRGEVSARTGGDSHELQRKLLEAESVRFDERGRIDLKRFRWERR